LLLDTLLLGTLLTGLVPVPVGAEVIVDEFEVVVIKPPGFAAVPEEDPS
jgi:hypothetical protein